MNLVTRRNAVIALAVFRILRFIARRRALRKTVALAVARRQRQKIIGAIAASLAALVAAGLFSRRRRSRALPEDSAGETDVSAQPRDAAGLGELPT
jgi:hypothetical protein